MKSPSLEKCIRVVGVILAIISGLSLLFCIALLGSAMEKRYSVTQSLGYWPLFTVLLLVVSGFFIFGAPHLVRAIGKNKSDEDKLG